MHRAGRARAVRETLRHTPPVCLGISRAARIPPGSRLARPIYDSSDRDFQLVGPRLSPRETCRAV